MVRESDNGNRGGGWWVSFGEAQMRGFGEEWWKTEGCNGLVVPTTQHDPNGPSDKPVWLFANGSMYLGEWKMQRATGRVVEDGVGVMYNATPFKLRGCIYVGQWKDGLRHGRGLTRWAESAPSWEKNYLPSSIIVEEVFAPETVRGAKTIGLPFCYEGRFKNNLRHDTAAKVILKDGTTRVGPWKDDVPLRDWWKDHEKRRHRAPTNAAYSAESRSEREHPRSRIENSRERCLTILSSEQRDVPSDQRLVSLRSKQPYRDVSTSAFSERDQPMASSRGRTDKSRERELIGLLAEQRNQPSPSQRASAAFSKSQQHRRDTRTPAFSEYVYEQFGASPFSRTEKSQERSWVSLATEQRDEPPDQPMLTAFLNYERPMPDARTSFTRPSPQHHAKPSAHRRHQVDPSLQEEDATERVTRHPSNRRYSFELSSEEDVSMNKPTPHRPFEPQQEDHITDRDTRHPSRHCYPFELSSEEDVSMNKPTARSHRPFEQSQQKDPVTVSPRSTTTTTSEENDRFYDIAEWIGDIIGYNPDEDEMNGYARELNNLGLHSVTMIQNECTPEEVEGFGWMKPFHKKRFCNYIHGIRTGN